MIRYAIKNERLPANSLSKDVAEGEAFSLAVLPIANLIEKESAYILEFNMIMETDKKPVMDGDQAVADALYDIMYEFDISCDFVGITEGVSPCINKEEYMSKSGSLGSSGTWFPLAIGSLSSLLLVSSFLWTYY